MLKDFFLNEVKSAVAKAVENNKLGAMSLKDEYALIVEKPKNPDFGDFGRAGGLCLEPKDGDSRRTEGGAGQQHSGEHPGPGGSTGNTGKDRGARA